VGIENTLQFMLPYRDVVHLADCNCSAGYIFARPDDHLAAEPQELQAEASSRVSTTCQDKSGTRSSIVIMQSRNSLFVNKVSFISL